MNNENLEHFETKSGSTDEPLSGQMNAPTNNPSTELDDSEKDVVSNTTVMTIATPFGAPAPKQDEEPAREEPVIEGFIKTGLTIMVLSTALIAPNKTTPGAELWLPVAKAVQDGTKLFNKLASHKGGAVVGVNIQSWQTKLANLCHAEYPKDLAYSKVTLKLGKKSPADFMADQVAQKPGMKMLVIDNLADFLPNWEMAENRAKSLSSGLRDLHIASVKHRVAFAAIFDMADASQSNLWEACKLVQSTSRFSVIHVKGEYLSEDTPEVRVSGDCLTTKLGYSSDNMWVEKVRAKKAHRENSNQNKVKAAIAQITGEFTALDVSVMGLEVKQVGNALNGLVTKGEVRRTSQYHYEKIVS